MVTSSIAASWCSWHPSSGHEDGGIQRVPLFCGLCVLGPMGASHDGRIRSSGSCDVNEKKKKSFRRDKMLFVGCTPVCWRLLYPDISLAGFRRPSCFGISAFDLTQVPVGCTILKIDVLVCNYLGKYSGSGHFQDHTYCLEVSKA